MKLLVKSCLLFPAAIVAVFASCSGEDDLKVTTEYVPLDIAAMSAVGNIQTRTAIDAEAFPVADAASIGLFVTKEDGSAYNSQASGYSNVAYTKAADATAWSCTSPILLSSTQGKIYGYYPYSAEATNATAIPVTSSVDGDDYMFLSAPTTTINRETPMPVNITMQHALSRLDITFVKDASISAASLTSFTLSGDGVATSGTMNVLNEGEITATKATTGFTYTPESAVALSASNTYKCLLVPATQEAKDLTVSCVINGVTFNKTLTSVALKPATRIAVTLILTGTDVEVTNVSVTGWTTTEAPSVGAQTITATVAPFIGEDGNPIDYYTFQWQEGDELGIFPLDKVQMAFDVKEANGSSASIDGGSWGVLRPEYSYAAYYPFSEDNYQIKMTELPVRYVGQKMDGNNPSANLSKYDFFVSAPKKASDNGAVTFELQHLGCLANFELILPEQGAYSYLSISCDEAMFVHEATNNLVTPALTPKKSYSTYRIDLKSVTTTEANQRVDIPVMFAPVNLSGKTITLSMLKNDGTLYSTTVGGKDMIAGKAYGYTPTSALAKVEDVPTAILLDGQSFNKSVKNLVHGSSSQSVSSSDNLVKEIRFDCQSTVTEGKLLSVSGSPYSIYGNFADGVFTISTAAAKITCTDMIAMFENLHSLKNVNLTGLDTQNVTNMGDMFYYCSSLTTLDLSGFNTQSVTSMARMFYHCSKMTTLDLSGFNTQNVTSMSYMFDFCHSLTTLDLSGFNTQNVTSMSYMFEQCYAMTSLNLGLSFKVANTKQSMCSYLGNDKENGGCKITCTSETQAALQDGTILPTYKISWDIIQ